MKAFFLTMPGNNSWNGKWSGDGDLYCRVVANKSEPGNYSYSFGDGWRASVEVRNVTAVEARKLRKRSRGFCGYDWMISSIERFGYIIPPSQWKETAK